MGEEDREDGEDMGKAMGEVQEENERLRAVVREYELKE